VVVGFKTDASLEEIAVMGKDVAMQIASMNPKFIKETDVDPDYIESEKKIMTQLVLNEGKDPGMVEKIVNGKIKKEIKEVCLVEQKFVKDSEVTVKQYVDGIAKEVGKSIEVVSMVRYEVGEGIEKKEENFAEEVAKQMAGS
jgi:elongation factor Ts